MLQDYKAYLIRVIFVTIDLESVYPILMDSLRYDGSAPDETLEEGTTIGQVLTFDGPRIVPVQLLMSISSALSIP